MGIVGLGLSLLLVGCSFPGKGSETTTPPQPAVTEASPSNVQGTTEQRKTTEKQATVKEISEMFLSKDYKGKDVLVVKCIRRVV